MFLTTIYRVGGFGGGVCGLTTPPPIPPPPTGMTSPLLGIQDSNLERWIQSPPCCQLHQSPFALRIVLHTQVARIRTHVKRSQPVLLWNPGRLACRDHTLPACKDLDHKGAGWLERSSPALVTLSHVDN